VWVFVDGVCVVWVFVGELGEVVFDFVLYLVDCDVEYVLIVLDEVDYFVGGGVFVDVCFVIY